MLKLEKLFHQHIPNSEFIKEAFTLMNGMFFLTLFCCFSWTIILEAKAILWSYIA